VRTASSSEAPPTAMAAAGAAEASIGRRTYEAISAVASFAL